MTKYYEPGSPKRRDYIPLTKAPSDLCYTETHRARRTRLKMPGIRCAWLSALCLAVFAIFARAQEVQGATEAINSTTPTSTQDEITIHTILVSNTTHYFTPNSINALPGDIVTFKFWPGNHSVIRAEYGYPCIPYEDLDGNESGGFYSGVQSPDEHDVESGNVSNDLAIYHAVSRLTRFAAPNLELDHQHDRPNILLLRCPGQLRQMGYAGRDQCGRGAPHCHTTQACKGKTSAYCNILHANVCANMVFQLIRKQPTP